MSQKTRTVYTPELRAEAVKMVIDQKLGTTEVSKRLKMPIQTLENWVSKAKKGLLTGTSTYNLTTVQLEDEVKRLKKELLASEVEREILKKATAYFAKDVLRSTRS